MPIQITLPPQLFASPLLVDPAMPTDPNLRAVVDDVLAKLRYSFAAVAAEDQPAASGELDQVFRGYLASRRPARRSEYRQWSRALLAAPPPIRTLQFRRYAAVEPQEYRTLGSNQLATRVGKLAVHGEPLKLALAKQTKIILKLPPGWQAPPDPDLQAGLAFRKMRLFIRSVRCIEETDEIGSDEIHIGGVVTNAFGESSSVSESEISDDFDEGEHVDFGWSKKFCGWNLKTDSAGFPYVYTALVAMAEKDDGGFWKFLKDLWQQVEGEVKAAIAGAAGAAIGALIGSVFAGVGAIIGAAFGAFIGWLISLFGDNPDDMVGTKCLLMTLAAPTKSYYDWAKLTSPQGWTKTLTYRGDGGKYEVDIAYRVFAQ